ncbi:hypothetical protein [Tessaracoccus antarcticus]|uniref:Uncharacterized protein n=1 Tax=Tessaracoccus antarcticus TaxID=2479848 RepID=A0A3M0G965_9ACTN|nr:hypothetical protein [Tessaracoccus antarcticus]RMB61494.1 hypothetical protein EAX62_02285 [Tessaracoccus antarcticus]
MSDPREPHDEPVDPGPEELGSAGPWRNVPRPTPEELVTPTEPGTLEAPRMPTAVKVGGIALVAVLLLLAAWLGLTLGGSGEPEPSPTPTVEETPWELAPPVTIGNLVQGETTTTPRGTQGDRDIVRSDYSDGTNKVVLLLSRPEDDLASYLKDTGIEKTEPVGDTTCGFSVDNNNIPVCARLVDNTAITVAGLTDQKFPELATLVNSFYSAMQ